MRQARPCRGGRAGGHPGSWQTTRTRGRDAEPGCKGGNRCRASRAKDRTDPRAPPPLGHRPLTPTEHDPRPDPKILSAVGRIAPGTELRSGLDDIIRSHEGALIVIGEPNELSSLFSAAGSGSTSRSPPQLLYELSKMDGAIIVTRAARSSPTRTSS